MNKKIYIASKTKHADKWRRLRNMFKDINGLELPGTTILNLTASWIDVTKRPKNKGERWPIAVACLKEIEAADFIIVYAERGEVFTDALIEIGLAIAKSTPLFFVGPVLPRRSIFGAHVLIFRYRTLGGAIGAIERTKIE